MEDINEYKIRECYVKLTRLSAQGKNLQIYLYILFVSNHWFFLVEYKIAQESTWLKLHNIHECHVVLNRLSERGIIWI